VRVPQPPGQTSNAGYPAGAANRGRLFFGYFLLATQKKVTGKTTSHLTDEKTSQPTKPPENGGKVAGYNPANDAR